MSQIQDDKKVLDGDRDKKLSDVDVDLRFQIPKKLLKKVKEMKLGIKAQHIWSSGNADRERWLRRQVRYLRDWDEFLESSAEGPFENSSSLHIPMPFIITKTFHARMYQALIADDFRFPAKARQEANVERETVISETMRYALKEWANGNEGVDEVLDDFVWQWVSTGVGLLKWRWDQQFTRFMDIEKQLEPTSEFTVDQEGNEVAVPQVKIVEKEVERVKETFNGPVLESINLEDFNMVGGGGNPQKAHTLQHRIYMTASQLLMLADQKIFDMDVVKEIIQSGPDNKSGGDSSGMKDERSQTAGMAGADSGNDNDQYEILETYWEVAIDDSGINSQIVTWSHRRKGGELRATYLHRISPDGRKPFFKSDFFRRKDQEFGIGLAEILHPLSVELDAMHNIRIDFGLLSVCPFGFIRASSSLEPEKIKYGPGDLIPVDNPQTDIVFPNLGNRVSFGLQEEAAIERMVERLTGVSDLALGVLSSQQGATRTATGTRALVGQASANLDIHLKRLFRTWKQVLEYLFHMLQKRIPPGLSFRITGQDSDNYWVNIRDAQDVAGDFDFEISSNSAQSDPGIRQQNAQTILQLVNNPLAIQLGIVNPRGYYEAIKTLMMSLQVKDFNKYFTVPRQFGIMLTPIEEFNRIKAGITVGITPEMDHQGFIEFFEKVQDSDELLGSLTQEQTLQVAAQAQAHAQMQQALGELQAQQRNSQQQAINQQGANNEQPQV